MVEASELLRRLRELRDIVEDIDGYVFAAVEVADELLPAMKESEALWALLEAVLGVAAGVENLRRDLELLIEDVRREAGGNAPTYLADIFDTTAKRNRDDTFFLVHWIHRHKPLYSHEKAVRRLRLWIEKTGGGGDG